MDCVVTDWVDGAEGCTAKCGGTKTQTRQIITPDANGGKQCPVLWQTVSCDNSGCPVDCVVGPWSPWSSCDPSCGPGHQTRLRTVSVAPQNGGVVCPALTESQSCTRGACPPCGCATVPSCVSNCHSQIGNCDRFKSFFDRCNSVGGFVRMLCQKCVDELNSCLNKKVPC